MRIIMIPTCIQESMKTSLQELLSTWQIEIHIDSSKR